MLQGAGDEGGGGDSVGEMEYFLMVCGDAGGLLASRLGGIVMEVFLAVSTETKCAFSRSEFRDDVDHGLAKARTSDHRP